ncbi:MAG TPA: cytidylate kinase-like family protein [Longimicrobiales bacterium]|nr:cytidylate kinase-like family protein [Longimicrobiales bacterium]
MADSPAPPSPRPVIGVVTVAREFGSGGSDLAHALGRRLGWRVVDKEVVARVARELEVPEREVAVRDEHVPGLAERVGAFLAGAFAEVTPPVVPPTRLDEREVAEVADAILMEAAARPPVILVGHGGMCLLSGREDVLHLRVVAPLEYRVGEVCRRLRMDGARAREEIRARDRDRAHYIRHRFQTAWEDPALYALVVNSAEVGPEDGARAVEAMLAGRVSPPAPRPG